MPKPPSAYGATTPSSLDPVEVVVMKLGRPYSAVSREYGEYVLELSKTGTKMQS